MTTEQALARLNLEVDLIPAGSSNRPGTRISPRYITIHNTANSAAGADARMHARYVKGPDARAREVSWHFTVDDRRCVKHLPTNEKAWHAGRGNGQSIGIEVCEHQGIDEAAAVERASLLTAVLMQAHAIPPERIVPHRFWTGKDCPRVLLREPGGFEAFRALAARHLEALALGGADGESVTVVAGTLDPGAATAPESPFPGVTEEAEEAAAAGGDERLAVMERLLGRLLVENQELRERLDLARDAD